MPLSNEERRRLDKLDEELSADDPQLARKLRSGLVQTVPPAGSISRGLAVMAALGLVILGMLCLVTGSGVLGGLVLSVGGYWLFSLRCPPRHGEE